MARKRIYWYVSEDGFKPRQALRMYELSGDRIVLNETWERIRSFVAGTVAGLVKDGHARGEFPVWSDDENSHRPLPVQHCLPHQPDPLA